MIAKARPLSAGLFLGFVLNPPAIDTVALEFPYQAVSWFDDELIVAGNVARNFVKCIITVFSCCFPKRSVAFFLLETKWATQRKEGLSARHAGVDGAEDPGGAGAAARLRHRPAR